MTFGEFLRHLRRRAGMTQADLAAALGFSEAQISRLEKQERLPDVTMVATRFVAALALQEEPQLALRLVELAALARGEKPPTALTIQRQVQSVPVTALQASPGQLPLPPTPLIGRARELDQICKRLTGHSGRLFTLTGPPGVGKTRLALAVGAALQPLYADGVHFVALAAVTDPALLPTALLAALNLTDNTNKSPQRRLIEGLRHQQLLVVLDNFEQLHTAAPLIAEWLAGCSGLHLLVTSRSALRVRGEQRYPLAPLTVDDATTLLVQRVQAIDPAFTPTATDRPLLEAICRRLDCLPLALELSAAQIELFSLPQLLSRLHAGRLDLLSSGPSDMPEHHQTLRAAISRSFALLSEEEQQLFGALSLFAGSFDLAAVEALGYPERCLQGLLHKSLVHSALAVGDQRRFLLLETVRDYAAEQLAVQGREAAMRCGHAAYYCVLAESAALAMQGPAKAQWLLRLDADLANLRAAFQWLLQHKAADALGLAGALKEFWYLRSYFQEGAQWLSAALARHPAAPDEQSRRRRAKALLANAQMTQHLGNYPQALQWVEESIALYHTAADQWGVAEGLRESGWILLGLGQRQAALDRFAVSLDAFRAVGDQAKIAAVLTSLAYLQSGKDFDYPRAVTYLSESIALLQALGDSDGLCFALHLQGEMALAAGELAVAAATVQQLVTLARAADYRRHLAMALTALAKIKLEQGGWAAALADAAEGLQLAQTIGDKDRIMAGHCYLGHGHRAMGTLAAALAHYHESLALAQTLANQHFVGEALFGCGAIALALDDTLVAVRFLSATTNLVDDFQPYFKAADRTPLQTLVAQAQVQSDPVAFAAAWATGQAWSFSEAILAAQHFCRLPTPH